MKVSTVAVASSVIVVAFFVAILYAPLVSAALWTETTDTDFSDGTFLSGATELIGIGDAAYIQITEDSLSWLERSPATDPGPREDPGMVYDSVNGELILFGGDAAGAGYKNDTWRYSYSTNSWSQVSVGAGPSDRVAFTMTFDPVQQVAVLYGGLDSVGNNLDDTWEFDAATDTWTNTTPVTRPRNLQSPGMAYAGGSVQRHILGSPNLAANFETWAYDAATNAWAQESTIGSPGSVYSFAMAYAANRNRVVLFGGADPFPPPGELLDDTWEYNPTTKAWTQVLSSGPPARTDHAMDFVPASNEIVLFGGRAVNPFADTWYYDGSAWTTKIIFGSPPPPRYSHGLAYDTANDALLVHAGRDFSNRMNDTWSLELGYRLEGKYESSTFDSFAANTDWQRIWWNKTPASQPAGTTLRFQIATSTSPTGPWQYAGPSGTVSTYFLNPGEAIPTTPFDNKRYIRYLADLITTDPAVTPFFEDITIEWYAAPADPCITNTSPANAQFGVDLMAPIVITFSEPMNTSSVTWLVQAVNPPTAFVPPFNDSWSNQDSVLTLSHTDPYQESTVYRVTITGEDLTGNGLVSCPTNPKPNPFMFGTMAVYPYIVSTSPANGDTDVLLDRSIVVTFSEPMDTPTVTWNITPTPPSTYNPTWSGMETVLTLSHTEPFIQCRVYTVDIRGDDKAGNPLVPGTAPNPFSFTTICINPYIVSTSPEHLEINVPFTKNILVNFSKSMDRNSVSWDIDPTPPTTYTASWNPQSTQLTLSHSTAFTACTPYTVFIQGSDTSGNPLIEGPPGAAPNPWTFQTAKGAGPCFFIILARPEHQETGVGLTTPILVAFNKNANAGSVSWALTPPDTTFTPTWSGPPEAPNLMLQLDPDVPYQTCRQYTMQIQGQAADGDTLVPGPVPNPWRFTTSGICPPEVTNTTPWNGQINVAFDEPVVITFSKPMNTPTVLWTIAPRLNLTESWSVGDTVLTLGHNPPGELFVGCTAYTVDIGAGESKDGLLLRDGPVPRRFTFTVFCPTGAPYINRTSPAHLEQGVALDRPIVIDFSEAMNTSTVFYTITPGVTNPSPSWSNGDTRLTITHDDFQDCTWYQVHVTAGKDLDGNDLVPGPRPNPWLFKTTCFPPTIISTSPSAGSFDVQLGDPIVITFSEPMNRNSVVVPVSPTPPTSYGRQWSPGDTVLTLSHTEDFRDCQVYTVGLVTGQDLQGNDLVPGPVPNPWTFSTTCRLLPPRGLTLTKVAPSTVRLTWTGNSAALWYHVYHSTDRFAAWPWPLRANVSAPTTQYDATPDGSDSSAHYYVLRSLNLTEVSGNSTMGVKIPYSVSFLPGRTNIQWFSLPYRPGYARASDIVRDIEGSLGPPTRIDVVARWNPSTQSSEVFFYYRGAWRGTDFFVQAGDGFWLGALSSFTWQVVGTDRTLTMNFAPSAFGNTWWISLPWTGPYQRASDVVIDIEGSLNTGAKIVEIGRWNAATQTTEVFRFQAGSWTGVDFSWSPGDGVYVKVVSAFAWNVDLITAYVP